MNLTYYIKFKFNSMYKVRNLGFIGRVRIIERKVYGGIEIIGDRGWY